MLKLLDDLGFQAALVVGGQAVIDLSAKALKAAGVTKDALREKLNAFHERQRAKSPSAPTKPEPLDPAIKSEAEELLRDPLLVERYFAHLAATGLVGERDPALAMLLVMVTRKTKKPLHAAIKATSSSGKNWLVDHVTACLPPGDFKSISDLSPKALMYLPESLNGKVVVITEAEGAERAEYSTRLAMSERKLSVLVTEKVEDEGGNRMEAHHREVEVSSSFVFTTTKPQMHSENETRLLELTLDESEEQTAAIVEAQAEAAANPPTAEQLAERTRRLEVWRAVLSLVEPKDVRIPQAKLLAASFSKARVRARRDFAKLLGLVAAHTLLHQHQRQEVDGYLVAEQADIDAAKRLCEALSGAVPPKLAKTAQALRSELGSTAFTPAGAADVLGCSVDYARRLLTDLESHEQVEQVEQGKGNRGGLWKMKGFLSPAQPPKPPLPPAVAPSSPQPSLPPPTASSHVEPPEAALSDSPTLPDISTGRTDSPATIRETSLSDCPTTGNGMSSTLLDFPGGEVPYRYVADEAFEERTAILEYEGGLSRPIAEEEATRQTRRLTQRPPPEAEPQF